MSIQWDRSLSEWSSGLRPAHFDVNVRYNVSRYQRNMSASPWEKKEIYGASYYGKSFEGECWKQIKTGLKIVGMGLAFLPVVTIPLLIWLGAHEKIVLWSIQLDTNTLLKYKITHLPDTSPASNTPSLDLKGMKDALGVLFQKANNLGSPEDAKKYFGTLCCVAKEMVPKQNKEDLRIDLINKGKLAIHEIPELNGEKDKILNYISTHGNKLTYLDLPSHLRLDDTELEEIVKACPHLKTFIHHSSKPGDITPKGASEILKLTQLEILQLGRNFPIPAVDCLKNLKELSLESASGIVPSLDALAQLEKLRLVNTSNIPSLDSLVNLKELRIEHDALTVPSLDNLISLEKLSITQSDQGGPIPSLDALVNLMDLSINNFGAIPSLQKQEKLTKLEIMNQAITRVDLTSKAPLQELRLSCAMLEALPELDHPKELHSLGVGEILFVLAGKDLSESIKQYTHLRRLHTPVFSADLMNHLPHLEELTQAGVGSTEFAGLDKISVVQKRQLKKLDIDLNFQQPLFSLDEFINLEELRVASALGKSVSFEKNTALKKLKLTTWDAGLKRLKHLDKLKQLTHLSLHHCRGLKLQKASVNDLENLTHLSVVSCNTQDKLVSERLVRLQEATVVTQ